MSSYHLPITHNSFFWLLFLFIISAIVRHYCLRPGHCSTLAGGFVMASGIFILGALSHLPWHNFITPILVLELMVIWLFIAASYSKSYFTNNFSRHTRYLLSSFGIGTWVAGTSLMAILLLKEFYSWHIVAWVLGILAIVLWLAYMRVAIKALWFLAYHPLRRVTGVILLTTVSTQSVVLLVNALLLHKVSDIFNITLITFGLIIYFICLLLILRFHFYIHLSRVITGWNSANSIGHGAMSISGLASLIPNSMPLIIILIMWGWSAIVLVFVEGISLLHLFRRIASKGLAQGAFIYNVSQWARVFTFGMFYAFTVTLNQHFLVNAKLNSDLGNIINFVTAYGQYVVLIILLIEIILFFVKYKK